MIPQPSADLASSITLGLFNKGRIRSAPAYVATAATTNVVMRPQAYTPPADAAQRWLSSSSASDTSAGTGARTVRITWFANDMSGPFEEIVTLNGTARVGTTATNIRFIQCMEVVTVGSGGSNAGSISMHTLGSGGSVIGQIAASDNRTFWGHHYVALGAKALITDIEIVANGAALSTVTMRVRNPIPTDSASINPMGTLRCATSSIPVWFATPIAIPGPAIVELFVQPSATGATTHWARIGVVEV